MMHCRHGSTPLAASIVALLWILLTPLAPTTSAFTTRSQRRTTSRQLPQIPLTPQPLNHQPLLGSFHKSTFSNYVGGPSSRRYLGLTEFSQSATNLVESLFQHSGVPLWQAFGINALGFAVLQKFLSKMLTGEGQVNALILGTSLWKTLGWRGWSVCVAYLFIGVIVTKVKFAEKEKMGIAESRGGRRGPENLWGSAATGLFCAICSRQGESFLGISSDLFVLAYVASLATKLADTFASEIGKAYGKTTFLITTFERVEPGTEGAVSLEGTAAAAVGGFLLSLYGWGVGMISVPGIAISTVAAFLATNVESLLGATLQEKKGLEWVTNEVINFFNTLVGAAFAIVGGILLLNM